MTQPQRFEVTVYGRRLTALGIHAALLPLTDVVTDRIEVCEVGEASTEEERGMAEPATNARVRVGQIWEDADPRSYRRRFRIVRIADELAHCVPVLSAAGMPASGRNTRVRLDRFRPTSTGYRLVEDVPEPAL